MASSSSPGDGGPPTPAGEGPPLPPQPPPSPKSPPTYPDFCGRHRLQVDVHVLNREIGFLEEEIHSLSDLQPASNCCKGVNEFVGTNPDPLLPVDRRRHRYHFWSWLGAKLCIGFSWVGCCACSCKTKTLDSNCCKWLKKHCCHSCRTQECCSCCSCKPPNQCNCCSCAPPKFCGCCSYIWPKSSCCRDFFSYSKRCCALPTCSCPEYYCGCVWSCSNCAGARYCPRCCRPCCISRCLCP